MNCIAIQRFATLMCCIVAFQTFAQSRYNKDSLISSRIADLEVFWKKYSEIPAEKKQVESYSIIPSLFKVEASDSITRTDYLNKLNNAKIKQLKQDVGVDLNASYLENFDPGLNSDDNLIYNRRLQAGIDWNILSDGYLNNRYKQKILRNENIINSLSPATTKLKGDDYVTISHRIIYSFNIHKIEILKQRQEIINDKMAIANELYLLKHLPRLELLQIMQQQVDVNSMEYIYSGYNDQLKYKMNEKALPKNRFPLFDVNIAKLIEGNSVQVSDSILKLKIANLELAHKPLSDIRLNTQFRYNYYDLVSTTVANRNFFSAGIGLSVPIPLGIKSNKEIVSAQAKLMEFDQKESVSAQQTDVLNSFYEFRYKLKQYNNFLEKRKRYEELIRVERVKEKFDDFEFNPLAALNLLDELLATDIELLDIQQELYLQLLDIHTKSPTDDLLSIIKPYVSDTLKSLPEKINRSIYIWSEAQEKYDAAYTEEYLRLNKITTAIISLRKDQSNKKEAELLMQRLKKSDIASELLIGSNKLLFSVNPGGYFDSLVSGMDKSLITAIHLDVEPHVLKEWDSNKELYLLKYTELLKRSKEYCRLKGWKLTVSIPVFYPEATLKEIYLHADHVYLMAYEHNDAAFIIRKVKEELMISSEKTTIALRAKDFKNRNECEKLIKELSQTLRFFNFAMHDLETFVKLDEVSVNQEK
ncbi:MAG: hypothetical protein M3R27_05955 [Bacteroidota bacterium]|nr:hypothetical protein [Bacteroidota bacterium]